MVSKSISDERLNPMPEAAASARMAITPAISVGTSEMIGDFDGMSTFKSAWSKSPMMPPRPTGSGHEPMAGRALASAAAASAPIRKNARRRRGRVSGRADRRRRAIKPSGASSAREASPKNCIIRSATMAPGRPRRLATGLPVAWFRLGSSTDQVTSAMTVQTMSTVRMTPPNSARRRPIKALIGPEISSKLARLVRVVRICRPWEP